MNKQEALKEALAVAEDRGGELSWLPGRYRVMWWCEEEEIDQEECFPYSPCSGYKPAKGKRHE